MSDSGKPPVDPQVGLDAPIPPWDPAPVHIVVHVQGTATSDPQETP